MTGVFKQSNPLNNFFLLIYGLLLKLPVFIIGKVAPPQQIDGFLFRQLLSLLGLSKGGHTFLASLLTFALLYLQAILLNNIAIKQKLFPRPNYLVGMTYLLVTSLFSEWFSLSAPLVVATLSIWVLYILSNLFALTQPKTVLFNVGLIIGIGTFFYAPLVAFVLMVLFGLAFTRAYRFSEWFVVLLGTITPYYFLLSILYLLDKWKGYKLPGVSFSSPHFAQNNLGYLALGLLLFTAVVGYIFIQQNFRKQLIQTRKSWRLIFLYLAISLVIPIINATSTFSYWILVAAPLSIFAAGLFYYTSKKWVANLVHWGMVCLVIAATYYAQK